MKYAIWKACERVNWQVMPWEFDALSLDKQADLLAYDRVCSEEVSQAYEKAAKKSGRKV